MINISQYRFRIGSFKQRVFRKKFLMHQEFDEIARWNKNRSGVIALLVGKVCFKMIILCVLFSPAWSATPTPGASSTWCPTTAVPLSWSLYSSKQVTINWTDSLVCSKNIRVGTYTGGGTGNFWARYVYGNISMVKGIHNMHLNIRSLKYKISEIKNIVSSEKPTILGLSECEIKKVNLDPIILKIPGYDLLYPKSWETHGFARVLIYVKKSFIYHQVHDLEDNLVQSIWLKGSFRNSKPVYFCHTYREHASAMGSSVNHQKDYLNIFLGQWEAAIEHNNATEPNEVHISGDINLDYLPARWLQPSYRLHSLTRLVQNVCNAHNFSQLVTEPTRLMYNSISNLTEVSCIDHIYCNYKHKCSTPRVIVCGASDHDIISYVRFSKGPPLPGRTMRRRSYKNFVKDDFLADLSTVDWRDVLTTEDLDQAVDLLTQKLNYVLDQHAPWILFQLRKNYSPWLTDETKDLMRQRDSWKAQAKQLRASSPDLVTEDQEKAWGEYKRIRNLINNRKGSEENEFKRRKIQESINDTAKVWKISKTFMKWKSTGTPTQLEENGRLVTSAKLIAQVMNNFFIEKIRSIRQSMAMVAINMAPCKQVMQNKKCKLSFSHISVSKVSKLLNSLSNSKCTATDNLDNFSVKTAAPVIAAPLHHIITLSTMQHRFPSKWKYAKVLPLHKKLDPMQKKNYRPVAILSPLSKVLEKSMYEQLYSYFTKNKILHPNIHGYRANRSTQTALVQMYDHWVQAASQGQVSGAVLLDLSAAFDLVPPDILVRKLRVYGVDEDSLAWIESYMSERFQAVWIDHVMSDFLQCEVGVPQGSNLGPLFFMLYVNDLPSTLTCNIEQYADDSTLYATGKNTEDISTVLETNCELVSNWMSENLLQLNADKTHILTLGTRERLAMTGTRVSVKMDGILLQEDQQHRETLLGIVMDANLKWHGQVEALLAKLKARLAGLAHVQHVLPYKEMKAVSEGLFNSVLGYCLPLFGGCEGGELHALQVLQNKAAQLVTKSPPRSPRNPMYERLGWLTVTQLVHYHTLLAVYRIRITGEPEYLARSLCSDNRNGHIIIRPTRLTLLQKSFKFRGACSWNDLPQAIRGLPSISSFKKAVKAWVQENIPRFLD